MLCNACPFECNVDRSVKPGRCRATDEIEVAQAQLHFWEEPPISGTRGSGTIFFSHCNLSCKFCQNYDISQIGFGKKVTPEKLLEIMFNLERQGAHNINLVSPTHYSLQLLPVLKKAKAKLKIPIVWNSNGYEKVETLRQLAGLVSIYLPDLKYFSDELARNFSSAPDYFKYATAAILEMKRQVGENIYDDEGIIQRGLIIRHLVLPGQVEDSRQVLNWIKTNLGADTPISLMAQYYPTYRAKELPGMNRRLRAAEYQEIKEHFLALGFEQGFLQELSSASPDYTPDFEGRGIEN
jgi:putative pyruvate formate lyase activating enzyme|uniref:Radical SAM protein n=1 Tax=candidate division WOR-3 bacterium TaxID=2052148 RepID=A0A7V3UZN7_UNCW3